MRNPEDSTLDVAEGSLRARITDAVCHALHPFPGVLAAWEGGSVAFGAADEYSDIDLNFLVDDTVSPARPLLFVSNAADLTSCLDAAVAWGKQLLDEMEPT